MKSHGRTNRPGLRIAIAGAVTALLGLSAPASTQERPPTGQQPPPTGQQPPAGMMGEPGGDASVDEAELEAFAEAYVNVREVREEFQGKLGGAEDPEQAAELQQEAQTKTIEAVEESGLSPQEYNQILEQVNSNPDVRARALEKIEAAGG